MKNLILLALVITLSGLTGWVMATRHTRHRLERRLNDVKPAEIGGRA